MSPVRASIGILTFESEATLERCLASVAGFTDVFISDGGSTDRTLAIAAAHGCRVLSQSRPGEPIKDFALERNRLLDAARESWFFYLDSDELMSHELRDEIRRTASTDANPYEAYRVRYLKTDAEAKKIYRTYKEYYQVRLVRTDIGARFIRPVHERIELPEGTLVGQIESAWHVPLDAGDLSPRLFLKKAWQRTGIQADAWKPAGVRDTFRRTIGTPLMLITKSLVKMVMVRLRWGGDAIPFSYEILRVLYACCIAVQSMRRVIRVAARVS